MPQCSRASWLEGYGWRYCATNAGECKGIGHRGRSPSRDAAVSGPENPFPDGAFDLVNSRVAPHHFSSPASFVSERVRVLKPGGHLLLLDCSVPDADTETEGCFMSWKNGVIRVMAGFFRVALGPTLCVATDSRSCVPN